VINITLNQGELIVSVKPFDKGVHEGAEVVDREFTTLIIRSDRGTFREMETRGSFQMKDFPRDLQWKSKRA